MGEGPWRISEKSIPLIIWGGERVLFYKGRGLFALFDFKGRHDYYRDKEYEAKIESKIS